MFILLENKLIITGEKQNKTTKTTIGWQIGEILAIIKIRKLKPRTIAAVYRFPKFLQIEAAILCIVCMTSYRLRYDTPSVLVDFVAVFKKNA